MMTRSLFVIYLMLSFTVLQAQDTIRLPRHGSGGIVSGCYGIVMDDGGDSNYTDTTNGYITIAPNWSTQVSLYFETFHYEQVFDYVRIYDGPGLGFPLIGQYTGTELEGQTINATGPYITIQQITDDIVTEGGFKATWTCVLGEEENELPILQVYPNPVRTSLSVDFNDAYSGSFLDISGRKLMDIYPGSADMTSFAPGIYFIAIRDKSGRPVHTKKIIKY